MAVVTSSVTWITFVVDEMTFEVASVADINLFVAKITFVVADIIIKEHVITSPVAKITYVVAEITLKVVCSHFLSGHDHFWSR